MRDSCHLLCLFLSRSATQVELTKEKPSPLLLGREFVRQYYTLLNQAPAMLHRFYGKDSSYVYGGLDSNGKPADKEIYRKVMSLNYTNCHTKIRHVDAHATPNDGVVVQVMGLLSNNNQALRRFMQTFFLAPEGSVANKFCVHNDIFRYQDEVFGGFVTEPQEESEEEVGEPEERQQTPEVVPDDSGTFYDQAVSSDLEKHLEEPVAEPEPDPEPKPEPEPVSEIQEEKSDSSPAPPDIAQTLQGKLRTFSWASVTSKNLPPSGAAPVTGIPPIREASDQGDIEPQRIVRHPDTHQLFIGNLPHENLKDFFQNYGNVVELRRNSGEKLPNVGFVVFDDAAPVQKVLSNRPIVFRGELLGTGTWRPGGGLGGGMRGPPRGGRAQTPGSGVGREIAPHTSAEE
ncbi:G3BP1-like [Ictidomys tridecemlineatus]|uniref:Ras GTPase-activating protein-binding protein 1 pseudogene n=1 Tax=Ictidomys tridecemlineatus TaxID=43179 RepID=A0A287DD86_ICTTR|nr:G3BP1-like [Ictidomys tridecemlineatus]